MARQQRRPSAGRRGAGLPRGALSVAAAGLLFLTAPAEADENIVLSPPRHNGTLPEKMLVFIPGGKVPNHKYVLTARAIQEAAGPLAVWVVIPAVFQRLCIISCSTTRLCAPLHSNVEAALALAQDQGWVRGKDSEDIWLAGHSLGGVCANTLFQSGPYDLTNYPKPVLVLNVELDGGLARPGKTAVWWRQHVAMRATRSEEYTLANKPVIVLPKANHSDFCPGFDVPGDLPAEVSQAQATASIGEVAGAFLQVQGLGLSLLERTRAFETLREKVSWTKDFLAPYLHAQDLERNVSDAGLSNEGASPFCAGVQHVLAGLSGADDNRVNVTDGFHISPSNLEHCHPNWTFSSGRLMVRTCSHTDYYPDIGNTGSITAASQIACKLLTGSRVAQQLNTTAQQVDCREGNKYAVRVAEALAAPSTLERYRRKGRGWCFLDDEPVPGNIGPVWVFSSSLKLESNATCMAVASASLRSEIDSSIYPGNHYCKLLSPARVLDWMMTDSLKPAEGAVDMTIWL